MKNTIQAIDNRITIGFFGLLLLGGGGYFWLWKAGRLPVVTPLPVSSQPVVMCLPTKADAEGPYYRAGVRERRKLSPEGAQGDRLVVKGRVMVECSQLVAGARVELWQADAGGNYHDDDYRGVVFTDQLGSYEFETVMPGAYGRDGVMRPAHIHFKLTLPDGRQLTSQMYFDANTGVDLSQLVKLQQVNEGWVGNFDVVWGQ
ncbi:MAG: hypothetical protein HY381_02110 [Candidatus Chisholmbacteria bacterium]|nr:hypothetical protein [Candidatus Chisholmbacteria bacterium]